MEKKTLFIVIISICFLVLIAVVVLLFVFLYGDITCKIVQEGPKLVIDHDGGADDAMAIFMALLYEQYFEGPTVVGLTTVNGNVGENQVFENSQRILDIAQRRDVPIYRGSTTSLVQSYPSDFYFGKDGLGDLDNVSYTAIEAQPGHAANALIEMSKKFEGELTVLVIGPSTNIALAIILDPCFINRLAHLYVAGGNIYSEDSPNPEFNAQLDVEAYHVIAKNAVQNKVTFIPFSPFYERDNDISMYWRTHVLGAINTTIMQLQIQFERIANSGKTSWIQLDPEAMAMVLDKSLIKENRCSDNDIILCGDQRAINTNNFTSCDKSNVNLAFPRPADYIKRFLYNVFSAELNELK